MDLYITKIAFGAENIVFCGLGKTFNGALESLNAVYPSPPELEELSTSPNGILLRWKNHQNVFVHVAKYPMEEFHGDKAWVVAKKYDSNNSEEIWAIFDDKQKAHAFVERNVDEPLWTFRKGANIEEVDGYKPFSRIIGDENPELNKIHFSIYETDIK